MPPVRDAAFHSLRGAPLAYPDRVLDDGAVAPEQSQHAGDGEQVAIDDQMKAAGCDEGHERGRQAWARARARG